MYDTVCSARQYAEVTEREKEVENDFDVVAVVASIGVAPDRFGQASDGCERSGLRRSGSFS